MSHVVQTEPTEALELSPVLGRRFALRLSHLLVAAGFGLCFLYHNYIPLFHSDLWGHVAYGHWILENGTLPQEDPFVPLAEGVRTLDTSWLGQVLFALAESTGGDAWLSHLFSVTVLATYLVLTAAFYTQTGRLGLSAGGALLVWLIASTRHAVIRPEIFSSFCFALLLWLLVWEDRFRESRSATAGRPWRSWLLVPLIFAAWANLHGAFVVGLAVLGCRFGGRVIEVLARSRNATTLFQDAEVRRRLLLGEAALAGTLINPYGADLLIHTLVFPANPNLNDVVEWFPLEMASFEGITIGLSWVLMLIVFRHSRTKVTPTSVLLLSVFVLAACLRVRMATWYAPVLMLVLMPHLADIVEQLRERLGGRAGLRAFCRRYPSLGHALFFRSFRYTLLSVLVLWIAFAFSPASQVVLGGKQRPPQHLHSRDTPRELTAFLREHPPAGQVANPQWWGDWLAWKGPRGLELMMTTNTVHVAPHRVWKDYLTIAAAQTGLKERLDRYRINTVIVHKSHQKQLEWTLRRDTDWQIVYEDDLGLVAQRKGSIRDAREDDRDTQTTSMPHRRTNRGNNFNTIER